MTPALEHVMEENEKPIRAVERMLLALAEPAAEPGQPDLRRAHFERALAEAEGNVTELTEPQVLARIADNKDAALRGNPVALAALRNDLWELGDINRESMLDANAQAQRLGTAGAWALVFLGLLGMVFSLALMRRARAKLINPVYEVGAVLDACRAGDSHRRFHATGGSVEFRGIAEVVNQLVTEHFANQERGWEAGAKLDRVALLRLLDQSRDPVFVFDTQGSIAAANEVALEMLSGPAGTQLREAVARVCRGESLEGIAVEPLGNLGFVCRVRAQREVGDTLGSLESVGAPRSFPSPVSPESLDIELLDPV
jgi:PAS domain-containing protein